ncbi:hypothetical protein CEXT_45731 [Caerostris extrusa]|uniref:Uncharacterized protein n=1 Tax=Caerostris extrusa TaxID=172846 RepID=A0AAV4MWZ2_CAEEX|nr:hypothetical protein CEXT_45731 [Caerostris extrusa]
MYFASDEKFRRSMDRWVFIKRGLGIWDNSFTVVLSRNGMYEKYSLYVTSGSPFLKMRETICRSQVVPSFGICHYDRVAFPRLESHSIAVDLRHING